MHGDKKLLNKAYPDKVRNSLERGVRSIGVNLILGDFVDSLSASTTRKGVKLDADLIVSARGPRPNTSWIISSLGNDIATDRGHLHVKPTLQLDAYPNIFALGDVIDLPEQKQLVKCGSQVPIVAANISSILSGSQPVKVYKGSVEMIMVTLGRVCESLKFVPGDCRLISFQNGGVGYLAALWGVMFGNWSTSTLKGKGLGIGIKRKALGQSA